MTTESLLLVGRTDGGDSEVLSTHAERLDRRNLVDAVHTATYDTEPIRELRGTVSGITTDRVYAVPMVAAHSHDTIEGIPAALSYAPGTVHYCEPIGASPAVTETLVSRASDHASGRDTTLVIVGFGSSAKPFHEQTAEYHATRLRERSEYGGVETCYLLQNPAVECVRYNVDTPKAVAVPLFVLPSEATERTIPEKLSVGRGGMAYTGPLGTHERITDAVAAELAKQRSLAEASGPGFESRLTADQRPVATDGEGVPR